MASKSRSGTNLAAGAFLIVGLIGFMVISAIVSGALDRLGDMNAYTVRFDLSRGAPGISVGSTVTLGGQPVGHVTGVSFLRDGSGAAEAIDVEIRVDADQPLFTDAGVVLVRPLLGGASSMNIVAVGSADAGALDESGLLLASTGAPGLLADAGLGNEQIEQVQQMIADGSDFLERAGAIAARLEDDIVVITEDAKAFSSTLRDTSARVSERLPEIEDDVAAAASTVARAGENLERAAQTTEAFVEEARDVLAESRPRINETLRLTQELMENIEAEHAPAAMELITRATSAADDLAGTAQRIETLVAESDPAVRRSLANARLASDQLRQASVEIRRNPWRLLARPDTKELEAEIIYDATRTHADAASDLRDTAASLQAMLDAAANNESPAVAERLDALRAELGEALERYRASQQSLIDLVDVDGTP